MVDIRKDVRLHTSVPVPPQIGHPCRRDRWRLASHITHRGSVPEGMGILWLMGQ
jgi:hypothetical protein